MASPPSHRRCSLRALLAVPLVVLVLALAGCGSGGSSATGSGAAPSTTGQVQFAKTKFVLHAGLAFGAFHHFIWKPFRAGDFRHPFSHKLTLVKAGLAVLFVRHELVLALHDAQSSPTLSRLVSPITALENRLHGVDTAVRNGNGAGLDSANATVGQIEQQAGQAGQPIQEQAPATP